MGLMDFFRQKEALIAIDIGSSSIKLAQLTYDGSQIRLINAASTPLGEEIFSNNVITKTSLVAEKISGLIEANGISEGRVVTAVPGPTVFTKRIKMPKLPPAELASNVQLEAGTFIPHNVDAVKIDYHVIGEAGKNQLDVLVVAVKNEVIDGFVQAIALAGLETAVLDVEYFALQNCFELNYPELLSKTVALIHVGARYSSINICRGGQSLFTGDIASGGKAFTDLLVEELGINNKDAELLKREASGPKARADVAEILDRKLEGVAAEYNRQLSLFWNASGAEEGIDRILVAGGGGLVKGFLEELSEKTGIACEQLNPFKAIVGKEGFDANYLQELTPFFAIGVGMGLRQPGDKITDNF